jgi:uncharacterized membrane protein
VPVVPALVATSVNTLGLAALAIGLFAYGRTERLPVAAAGIVPVLLEIETAWRGKPLTLAIACALAGVLLLAAFELASWSAQLSATGSDREAHRAQARTLVRELAVVAALTAVLVVATRVTGHHSVFGILGGVAAIGLGGGLLWLMRRPLRKA